MYYKVGDEITDFATVDIFAKEESKDFFYAKNMYTSVV